MATSKIQIGATVVSPKHGKGTIVSIITKSTGYVEVDYNGNIKKEMAFNLTDENGQSMKAKPVAKPMSDAAHARFMKDFNMAQLQDRYFDSQIAEMKRRGMINSDNTLR